MNKNNILRSINLILVFSFLIQGLTIVFMLFDMKFLNPKLVFAWHKYNGLVLIALILLHVTLNFSWIKTNYFKRT
ncbi:MAG: hypothetical protein HQL26_01040 [Candidatus Omnitrophica bacterium]|nr:hypothetical protein [Candidatus Omnitrophota bacterium]